jgi:hypothetical protein
VISLQFEDGPDGGWSFTSIYRGQSHDINCLVLWDKKTLLTGGVTTDICIYKLKSGRFPDQFGKKNQTKAPKLRHVPPFSFTKRISFSQNSQEGSLFLSNDGEKLDLVNAQSGQCLFRIEKKNDTGITTHFLSEKYIVYSDLKETSVFSYDLEEMTLVKLNKKIKQKSNLTCLPPAVSLWIDEQSNMHILD